jgi:hypothetical protein
MGESVDPPRHEFTMLERPLVVADSKSWPLCTPSSENLIAGLGDQPPKGYRKVTGIGRAWA